MFQWEGKKVGSGAPPIKTEKGWLIIYHAVHGGYFGYYLDAVSREIIPARAAVQGSRPLLIKGACYDSTIECGIKRVDICAY